MIDKIDFQWLLDEWKWWRDNAYETKDFYHYCWMLKEVQKTFGSLYSELLDNPEREKTITFLEDVLRLVSQERKRIGEQI